MEITAPATNNIPAEIGIAAVLSEMFLVSVTVVVSTVWDPVTVVVTVTVAVDVTTVRGGVTKMVAVTVFAGVEDVLVEEEASNPWMLLSSIKSSDFTSIPSFTHHSSTLILTKVSFSYHT